MKSLLDASLNSKILRLAPAHHVVDVSPEYLDLLKLGRGVSIPIWSGGSELTIYGDRVVNWAFRAWHDSVHIALQADFSLEGETRVAMEQARILGGAHGRIMLAEVVDQLRYFEAHGRFPVDQLSYMRQVLKGAL